MLNANINDIEVYPRQATSTTSTHICNADLVLRALRNTANLAEALTFCGAYISVTSTTTISVPTTLISTETAVTTVFYKREDGSYGSYNPEEDSYEEMIRRRGEGDELEYPRWLATTFAASRVTSACKCLTLPEISTTVLVTKFVTATVVETESVKTTPSTSSTTKATCSSATTGSSSSGSEEEEEEGSTTSPTTSSTTTSEEPEETTTPTTTPTTTGEEPETTSSTTTTTTTTSEEPEETTTPPTTPTTTGEEPETTSSTTTTTTSEEPEDTTTSSATATATTSEEPEATGGSEEPETITAEDEREADPTTTTSEEPASEPTTTEEPEPETTTSEEPEPKTTTSEDPESATPPGPSPNENPTTATTTTSSTTTSPTGTPTVYLGCYIDSISGKALRYQFPDDTLTPSVCANICSSRGYTYYGVEYSRECYCDNSLNTASFQVLSEECDMTCAGDSSQKCGGRDRINIYTFDTNVEGREEPDVNNDDIEYTSLGCYQEPPSGKALSKVFSSNSMTHELCQYYCWSLGQAKFAGVEYGRECWCGNDLNPAATPASPPSSCNMPCSGDSSKTCGAGGYLELYSSGPPVPTTTSSSSTTAPPSSTSTTSTATIIDTASFTTPTGICNPVEWSPATGYNFHFTSNDALSQWTVSGVSTSVTTYFVNGDINPSALQLLFTGSSTVTLSRIIPVTAGITYSITWNTYSPDISLSISAVSDSSVTDVTTPSSSFSSKELTITPTVDSVTLSITIPGVVDAEVILDAVDIRPISAGTFTPPTLGSEVKLINFKNGGDVSEGVSYVGNVVETITPSGAGILGYTTGVTEEASARDVEFGPVPFSASIVTYSVTASLSNFPGNDEQWVLQTKIKSKKSNGCFVGVSYGGAVIARTPLSGCQDVWEDVKSVPFVIPEGASGDVVVSVECGSGGFVAEVWVDDVVVRVVEGMAVNRF
ncbi:uncharacterized protein DFL_000543 [Arthrobotrys flagrans]|uniref:WSC domain-containing protein n=1 Tax=Arthrobotrys flagrans TaxID=97331 RepID=A0A437AFF5_ARTFL|nr:hypothetical protein DFL_000543 [Arthrobotrys flagrans]